MNGEFAINGLLTQAAGLQQLVAGRIYPDLMPDSPVYPSVTYQMMDDSSERGSTSDPLLKTAVYQISAWSKNRLESLAVSKQIVSALDRKRKITVAGIRVDDCFYKSAIGLVDFETKTYFVHLTFKIHYRDPL